MPGEGIHCEACGLPPHDGEGRAIASAEPPAGWHMRRIGRRSFVLCDVCGDIQHFKGGVSAYLQEALGIGPRAFPDFSEAGAGLHRLRRHPDREGGE
jgi:hypothetical protein